MTQGATGDIIVAGASLEFSGERLFSDLSFTVADRQWTCVLGPSGVGKTTLLRMIAGLAPIAPPGRLGWAAPVSLSASIAYMAQDDLLLPWLSVADNIALGARLRRERRDPEAVRRLLGLVGLDGFGRRPVASLSGGQRQRVALARTLMEYRPVVLMDEPFSALDAITRARLQDLAARLLDGRTVLLVTHDPLEALRLGDHIYVMSGRPAAFGDALTPAGRRPRAVDDPDVLRAQGELLAELTAATRTSAWEIGT